MERKYRINEIFHSLQGEGYNTGRAALFVRFSGCNLDCPYCDTKHETYTEMTAAEIINRLRLIMEYTFSYANASQQQCRVAGDRVADTRYLVVLTGGEPSLQADEAFVDLLHQEGFEVAMESNGTHPAPRNLDWLTLSPKGIGWNHVFTDGSDGWRKVDELKVVCTEFTIPDDRLPPTLPPMHLYIQPCDTGDESRNLLVRLHCLEYVKEHPWWRLSLQTHKLIGIH